MSTQAQILETETETTSQTTTISSVHQMLESLVELAATQSQNVRDMHRNLKRLVAEVDKEQKKLQKTKPRRAVIQKPVAVIPAMTAFLVAQNAELFEGGYTRQTMMRAVSGYIKTAKLQLEDNKKHWKPDATMISLFKLDSKQVFSFMNINGLLSKVVQPALVKA